MDVGSPANSMSKTARGSSKKRQQESLQSYYVMSKLNSISSLSAFERIRLDVSHAVVRKTQEKNSYRATPRQTQRSPVRLLQTSRRREESAQTERSRVSRMLTSEQKLEESRLRLDDFYYQRLLILDAELDLMILSQQAAKKAAQKRISNETKKTESMQKEIETKRSVLAKSQKDVNLFYEFLSYLKNPNKETPVTSIKLERESVIEEHFNEMVLLLTQQTTDYDSQIRLKEQELAQTKEQVDIAKQKLKKEREAKYRSKLSKLESQKLSLAVEAIALEKTQLIQQAAKIHQEVQFCRELGTATELQINHSKTICESILKVLRQQFFQAAALKKQLPKLTREIRLRASNREKYTFKRQAQQKKIEMLRQKLSKLTVPPPPLHDSSIQPMQ